MLCTRCARTAQRILDGGADYLMAVKSNARETFKFLRSHRLELVRDGHHAEEPAKAHGRLEQRTIDVMTPLPKAINYPGVRQIARVQRYREDSQTGAGARHRATRPPTSSLPWMPPRSFSG